MIRIELAMALGVIAAFNPFLSKRPGLMMISHDIGKWDNRKSAKPGLPMRPGLLCRVRHLIRGRID